MSVCAIFIWDSSSVCILVLSPLAGPQTPLFSLSQKYNSLIPLSS